MASTQQHRCVFVGNIPYDATEEQLIQICEEVGPVVSFRFRETQFLRHQSQTKRIFDISLPLVIDRDTGKPKGYGFCEYKDEETALSARRNLQGYEINGRQLRVDFAENDKGADRNREQGRGGPGLATNVDAQKQVGSPATLGDATFYQPIGLPIAMTASSVMAGALGGSQTGQVNQNGLQNQSLIGNDPLTHHLANMSRSQLNQVISEMKMLSMQNKDLARQLLLVSPQLPKALFQAQIILGMVTPQMMPNLRQQTPNAAVPTPQPPMQHTIQGHRPPVQTLPGLPSFTPLSSVSQNPLAHNQFSAPLPLHPQQRPQLPNLNQMVPPSQNTVPAHSGPSTRISTRPQSLSGLPPVSSSSFRPVQAPPLQHPGHAGMKTTQNVNIQPTFQSRSIPSDPGYKVASSVPPASVEAIKKDTPVRAKTFRDTTLASRTNTLTNLPSVASLSDYKDSQDQMVRPSKVMKLNNERGTPFSSAGLATPSATAVASSSGAAGQSSSLEVQNMEKQAPQFPPDVDPALLQQVLNLTPEQLSSLPPEQQLQVIQLQQMLR
ncbi:cleavage stimulating factor 64 isoform X2 [Spinacia oleracea]|uniref:Cleavage stimulating factor 64 isoform X2 n=1 Tax=Spinacia oleracea TaxID=3562 RepID=A0ABM3QU52_SPIOL|nr:cleavage stimulating factor 64 isoform X2 [Spinacia oleracea]